MAFVARINGETVVIKVLSEDEQEKLMFLKEAKILHGIKSVHIVKSVKVSYKTMFGKATCCHIDSVTYRSGHLQLILNVSRKQL